MTTNWMQRITDLKRLVRELKAERDTLLNSIATLLDSVALHAAESREWQKRYQRALAKLAGRAETIERLMARVRKLEAANDFFKSCLQMHSPKMDGKHSWRFRSGWPITSARGATPDEAVADAMRLVADAKGEETANCPECDREPELVTVTSIFGTWPGDKDDGFEDAIDELRHPERHGGKNETENER